VWILVRLSAFSLCSDVFVTFLFFFLFHLTFLHGVSYQDHIFLSISPPDGLEVLNIAYPNTVEELREHIFPMWPSGAAHQVHARHDWRVKFAGSPWSSKGQDSIMYVCGFTPFARLV
jgi:hypothetical protein